ncbi:phosphoenolpyruvate--protein phosphotransferase [Candidatus Omnitrophota bacterium]
MPKKKKIMSQFTKSIADKPVSIYDHSASFIKELSVEIERAKRYKRPLSLLFFAIQDLEGDKKLTGDLALKKIAEAVQGSVRVTDRVYRYGKKEFICILPETDLKSAAIVARRLREKIDFISAHVLKKEKDPSFRIKARIIQYTTGDVKSFIDASNKIIYETLQAGKKSARLVKLDRSRKEKADNEITKKKKRRTVIKGLSISSGFAIGKAFVYKDILIRDMALYGIEERNIRNEFQRIEKAIVHASKDLQKMKDIVTSDLDKQHADIFLSHKEMLKDKQLLSDLRIELERELINAENVVKNVFTDWAKKFKVSESDVIKSKADDMDDLSRRLMRILLGYEMSILEMLPPDSIVVAKILLPSDTVYIKTKNVKGIVVKKGSSNSHSAILARAFGVPAISNIDKSIDVINNKDEIILDGEKGIAIVRPSKNDKDKYKTKIRLAARKDIRAIARAKKVSKTLSGESIKVCANASSKEEFRAAVKNGCDGIGMFRIERIYLASKSLPDENYLIECFDNILTEARKKEITVRLLDIGGDKRLPYLALDDELNPALGLRGVRVLLKHKNVLKTQVRVIIKLSKKYKLRILIPMITFPREVKEIRNIIKNCAVELGKEYASSIDNIKIGTMIETPAAVANIEEIAKLSDFISIGTNDLAQYLMAVGRESAYASEYYEEGQDILLSSIKNVAEVTNKLKAECSICGEIAGDVRWTNKLLSIGIRQLSVTPSLIPILKEKIRTIKI